MMARWHGGMVAWWHGDVALTYAGEAHDEGDAQAGVEEVVLVVVDAVVEQLGPVVRREDDERRGREVAVVKVTEQPPHLGTTGRGKRVPD